MDIVYGIRDITLNIIKKYDQILILFIRFIAGIIIYDVIGDIGYYNQAFVAISNMGAVFNIFMGILFAILPLNANYLMLIFFTTIQFTSQLEIASIVFLGLACVFLFYGHFAKKENVLIILTIFAFHFNIPYIVPIIAGIFFSITSIIPIAIGIFVISYGRLIMNLVDSGQVTVTGSIEAIDIGIDEILHAFMSIYETFTANSEPIQNLIFTTIAMFVTFVFVYIISRLSVNYSKELAICLGTILNIFSFILASMFSDLVPSVMFIFVFSILSGVFMYLYNFFVSALDYRRAGRVEFQDEDYYYYVKYIPKKISSYSYKPDNDNTYEYSLDDIEVIENDLKPVRKRENIYIEQQTDKEDYRNINKINKNKTRTTIRGSKRYVEKD
ncbi:MAG: hypothetical protein FWF57_07995 [Defluviitaleaceae bacterium]|nr:hypothetical protein [Defluviitaleaceae bacterium]